VHHDFDFKIDLYFEYPLTDYELNFDHKVTLIDNFTYLKENLTLSDPALLDFLLELDVFNQWEVAEIRSRPTDHDGIDLLLQFILRTSPDQYQQFLGSLQRANHKHVYNKLTGIKYNQYGYHFFVCNLNGHIF